MGSEKADLIETERRVVVTRDWGVGEGLPWWLSGKESACNAGASGDVGSNPELGRSPGGGHGNPSPVFLPGESPGQRSLAGYSL